MRGRLFHLGSYPGIVADHGSEDEVVGEVYSMRDPEALLSLLDDYEGCGSRAAEPFEFTRERGMAVLGSGDSLECWFYRYRGAVDALRRIRSGDWLAGDLTGDRER